MKKSDLLKLIKEEYKAILKCNKNVSKYVFPKMGQQRLINWPAY
jgi:hypothetical protein